MFKKILIANRGEIACRVIRTCRRLGIATVAVHSDADALALHVRMADEAVAIGGAAAADSYLLADRIIAAALATGAEAVHPGYGFLSEKADFASRLEAAGIAFIGPGPAAIAAMGDKIESKKLAHAAGVSTVPGHLDVIADEAEAVRIAQGIGYPVMIKASAGGGGKGMRIARSDAEAEEGFRSARSEARSSFADDRVFIEKYVEEPRHIEIQVLADAQGNTIHLGERECSIQRRHQKVIEEAPSPFLDEATRQAMGAQAVALAKAVGYRSAGTVEFIVDRDRNFYFLEMNTRLQVEHPVTEMVTGLDLVEEMIRVAAGLPLRIGQDDVRLQGWAIEARVYAEDPYRNFLPSIGRVGRYRPPSGEGIRVDTGIYEGAEISMHYDPMIAKLVAFGPDRETARLRLAAALDAYEIGGVTHNVGFLSAVLARPRFATGRLTTNYIAEEFPGGFHGADLSAGTCRDLALVAAFVHHRTAMRDGAASGRMPGRHHRPHADWIAIAGDDERRLSVVDDEAGATITIGLPSGDDRTIGGKADAPSGDDRTIGGLGVRIEGEWHPGQPLFRGLVGGREMTVQVARQRTGWRLSHGGAVLDYRVLSPRVAELARLMPVKAAPDLSRFLLSPMPGLLTQVPVAEGQDVKAGETLAVVEAMKMENILRATRDGRIGKIHAAAGSSLSVDQKILEFE
ncbi:biotin carboxyl carrier protein /biotin carboxylase [Stella humosa]|uniref:propionyl-CoA carboxylase n=1 Tax=Stella humosa TaxID=94 RepID=A0A3N1M441_9PROT|nr:acetyl/propionyl/methylcrotonyl-CoA carboxylase subunit alpha [Stella humosa]ROQ00512.1 biotin carboxyl carrier protein /biotin carboxylase [Stella humosa]BBK30244.1 acetyl/propionyl-CoA carboxylase subunit alpha [Stella humosa]